MHASKAIYVQYITSGTLLHGKSLGTLERMFWLISAQRAKDINKTKKRERITAMPNDRKGSKQINSARLANAGLRKERKAHGHFSRHTREKKVKTIKIDKGTIQTGKSIVYTNKLSHNTTHVAGTRHELKGEN